LKKFCAKFGINYEKYFEDLEKLYDDTYALNGEQKTLLGKAYEDGKTKKREEGTDSDISYYEGGEEKEITYSKSKIAAYYVENFSDATKFQLLDPTLVELAMKETKVENSNVIISEK